MFEGGWPEPRYGNYFRVGYNAVEFMIEIGQAYDREVPGPPHTRLVLAPLYARELLQLLSAQIAEYELRYGQIQPVE